MYLWLGINVDNQLQDIQKIAKKIEKEIGFENSNFTLPWHISLKMSFYIQKEQYSAIIDDIICFYQSIQPFEIEVKGIEYDQNICWIMMKENQFLNQIHDQLNQMLLEKYHIPLHEYDLDYKFHTTLFMDKDENKVKEAFNAIKDRKIPSKLHAFLFVIGSSDSGKLGSYRLTHEIQK